MIKRSFGVGKNFDFFIVDRLVKVICKAFHFKSTIQFAVTVRYGGPRRIRFNDVSFIVTPVLCQK